jgi:hypothetical protein
MTAYLHVDPPRRVQEVRQPGQFFDFHVIAGVFCLKKMPIVVCDRLTEAAGQSTAPQAVFDQPIVEFQIRDIVRQAQI